MTEVKDSDEVAQKEPVDDKELTTEDSGTFGSYHQKHKLPAHLVTLQHEGQEMPDVEQPNSTVYTSENAMSSPLLLEMQETVCRQCGHKVTTADNISKTCQCNSSVLAPCEIGSEDLVATSERKVEKTPSWEGEVNTSTSTSYMNLECPKMGDGQTKAIDNTFSGNIFSSLEISRKRSSESIREESLDTTPTASDITTNAKETTPALTEDAMNEGMGSSNPLVEINLTSNSFAKDSLDDTGLRCNLSSESDFSTSIAQEVSDDLGNANLLGDFVEDRVRMQDDNMLFDGPDQEDMVQEIANHVDNREPMEDTTVELTENTATMNERDINFTVQSFEMNPGQKLDAGEYSGRLSSPKHAMDAPPLLSGNGKIMISTGSQIGGHMSQSTQTNSPVSKPQTFNDTGKILTTDTDLQQKQLVSHDNRMETPSRKVSQNKSMEEMTLIELKEEQVIFDTDMEVSLAGPEKLEQVDMFMIDEQRHDYSSNASYVEEGRGYKAIYNIVPASMGTESSYETQQSGDHSSILMQQHGKQEDNREQPAKELKSTQELPSHPVLLLYGEKEDSSEHVTTEVSSVLGSNQMQAFPTHPVILQFETQGINEKPTAELGSVIGHGPEPYVIKTTTMAGPTEKELEPMEITTIGPKNNTVPNVQKHVPYTSTGMDIIITGPSGQQLGSLYAHDSISNVSEVKESGCKEVQPVLYSSYSAVTTKSSGKPDNDVISTYEDDELEQDAHELIELFEEMREAETGVKDFTTKIGLIRDFKCKNSIFSHKGKHVEENDDLWSNVSVFTETSWISLDNAAIDEETKEGMNLVTGNVAALDDRQLSVLANIHMFNAEESERDETGVARTDGMLREFPDKLTPYPFRIEGKGETHSWSNDRVSLNDVTIAEEVEGIMILDSTGGKGGSAQLLERCQEVIRELRAPDVKNIQTFRAEAIIKDESVERVYKDGGESVDVDDSVMETILSLRKEWQSPSGAGQAVGDPLVQNSSINAELVPNSPNAELLYSKDDEMDMRRIEDGNTHSLCYAADDCILRTIDQLRAEGSFFMTGNGGSNVTGLHPESDLADSRVSVKSQGDFHVSTNDTYHLKDVNETDSVWRDYRDWDNNDSKCSYRFRKRENSNSRAVLKNKQRENKQMKQSYSSKRSLKTNSKEVITSAHNGLHPTSSSSSLEETHTQIKIHHSFCEVYSGAPVLQSDDESNKSA